MEKIADMLREGKPRSLGRADEVMKLVMKQNGRLPELFDCLFDNDEIVRTRASDALEKVCRQHPSLLKPYTRRLLNEVSQINQPSMQWHLAQMLGELPLTDEGRFAAIQVLERNLEESNDWIVINYTLETLAKFAEDDEDLRADLLEALEDWQHNSHKSIAARAKKLLTKLESIED